MRIVSIGMAALLMLTLAGCMHAPGGIAPSTIPLAPGGYTVVKEDVRGRDCRVAILGLIPVTSGNKTSNAVRSALSKAPGATALVNVTSDAYTQFWILWSNACTEVRGTAVTPS
ncbi:MAG: hypothetical protein ABFS41_01190 [Myxococcota bacterium]